MSHIGCKSTFTTSTKLGKPVQQIARFPLVRFVGHYVYLGKFVRLSNPGTLLGTRAHVARMRFRKMAQKSRLTIVLCHRSLERILLMRISIATLSELV